LGQYVTAIKTFAVAIANKTRTQMPDVEANAQTIAAAANHIYDGMHNIVRQLRPGALDDLGLADALRDTVAIWSKQNQAIEFSLNLSGDFSTLGETLNINLYRIVQEAVTNALRYAHASTLEINLQNSDNELQLTVKDNGVGMNMNDVDQSKHFGLLGMRERAQALRGSFSVDSTPGQGTLICVIIPAKLTA
jgi:signal transduction histidine kinase